MPTVVAKVWYEIGDCKAGREEEWQGILGKVGEPCWVRLAEKAWHARGGWQSMLGENG